jgi:gliding motility-associated-like protein
LSGTLPNLTYSPDPNFFGVDSFTFKVNDGTSDSNIATVTITVNTVNDVPVALNQTVLYQLNTPSDFTLTAFDADGDPLTYTIVTQPANGTLSGTVPGILTYTPNGGFNGTDSFTFKVNDGTVDSNIATVTFNFDNMVNDPPVADDQCVFVFEDNNVNITLTGSDPDGDPLNFIIVTLPKHGKITGSTPNIVYTPNLNYNGQDTIWFKVNDGTIDSDDAYVCITVEPVNDPPVADSQIITVQEDEPKAITLTGSDVEGDPLTFILFNQPSHGTLTGTAPNLTYTPDPNYYGTDSFAFYVDDGNDGSNTGYITINVVPVNDDPVSSDVNVTTPEDTPVTVNLSASDVDGNSLTYSIVDAPQHGTLSCNNCANPIYTPSLNYYGSDSFTFKANDGTVDSNISTVSITITPVNDAPIADNQTVTVQEDTPKEITLTGSDVESDPLTITVITQPTHGTLSGTGDIVTYTPATDYNGPDNFTFQVNDGTLTSNVATIFINVVPVNDPPVILVNNNPVDTVYVSTPEDTPVNFCFDAEDKENDNLAVGTITNTEGGGSIVAGAGGSANEFCFTFTPDQDYNGKSIWTIDICDDGNPSLCKEVTIDIIVTPVQDAPTAHDQNVSVVEDTPTYITLDGTDPDAGDVLTYTIVTPPAHGTISGSGSEITYTPDENYNGPDSFTYKVNDGTDDSNIATVTIDVTPVNDPPIINAIPIIYVPEDSLVQICLGVIEIEGNSLTYNQPTYVSGGEGTMTRDSDNEFCFIYQPPKDFNGDSYWKFTVCDNGNPSMCSEVEVHIIVTPVNDPPIAVDDYVVAKSFLKTDPVNILANDTDVDNDPLVLTITPIVGPFHGTVTMTADGTFTYQSEQGYEGPDSIRYQVCDTGVPQLCDEGNVFIEVGPAPFRIYTGFSPNGDGINDYWRIDGIEEYPNNKVKVFDRYNNTIFLMSGYNNDENSWKGRPNHGLISGNLPDGTYYYVVDLGDGSGLLSGYVVLKKD